MSELAKSLQSDQTGSFDEAIISILDKDEIIERYTQLIEGRGGPWIRINSRAPYTLGSFSVLTVVPMREGIPVEDVSPNDYDAPKIAQTSRELAESRIAIIKKNAEKVESYRQRGRISKIGSFLRLIAGKESDYPTLDVLYNHTFPSAVIIRSEAQVEEVLIDQKIEEEHLASLAPEKLI